MRSFSRTHDGDASVEQVYAVLTGPDWAAQRAAALGDSSVLISREEKEDGVTQVISRAVPSGVPGFLAKLLPANPTAVTTDVWGPSEGGVRRCTWTAEITGTPARLKGTMTIEPLPGGGSRHTVEGEAKVAVPLVGGKAESYIAEQCAKLAEAEAGVVEQVIHGA